MGAVTVERCGAIVFGAAALAAGACNKLWDIDELRFRDPAAAGGADQASTTSATTASSGGGGSATVSSSAASGASGGGGSGGCQPIVPVPGAACSDCETAAEAAVPFDRIPTLCGLETFDPCACAISCERGFNSCSKFVALAACVALQCSGDCGGPGCFRQGASQDCTDCATNSCETTGTACLSDDPCENGAIDGDESDIDCGGTVCPPCP